MRKIFSVSMVLSLVLAGVPSIYAGLRNSASVNASLNSVSESMKVREREP
jgi:hypothetical protein